MATLATGKSLVLSQRDSENKMLPNHSSSMVYIRSDKHEEEGLHGDRGFGIRKVEGQSVDIPVSVLWPFPCLHWLLLPLPDAALET